MIQVGEYNELEVIKELDFGIYLREGDVEILMPAKWVPKGTKIGDFLNVFIFRDSDDRLIATTVKPLAVAESFAFLEAKQVNDIGA
ncbi:MAG: S1-like domain-containing RNA-binding protein, partial [Bacteroidia bacterium]